MDKNLKTIILGFIISLTNVLIAQNSTDIELHNRYWNLALQGVFHLEAETLEAKTSYFNHNQKIILQNNYL